VVASCTVMNHLSGVDRLANRFTVMRHAQSTANAGGIIVSRIENDRQGDYGLTEHGRQQALAAAQSCGLPGDTVIYSSDFCRARQTAEIVRAQLGAQEVVIAEGLRERRFGHWEGSATGNYAHVWAADETDPVHADGNVEPAAAVLDRATALIAQLERQHCGRDILLVSHGDTLQILQAGFSGVDPSKHRLLPHLAMAEIRPLRLRQGSTGGCLALRLARISMPRLAGALAECGEYLGTALSPPPAACGGVRLSLSGRLVRQVVLEHLRVKLRLVMSPGKRPYGQVALPVPVHDEPRRIGQH
jgi:broad specificity phosphatase PhoE